MVYACGDFSNFLRSVTARSDCGGSCTQFYFVFKFKGLGAFYYIMSNMKGNNNVIS